MNVRRGWHESTLSRGQWWLTTALLQLAIAVFTFVGARPDGSLYFQPLDPAPLLAISLVMACVVLRARAPWAFLGVALIADLIALSGPPVPFPGFGFKLGYLIALFSVVSSTTLRNTVLVTLGAALLELAVLMLVRGFPIWTFFPMSSTALLIPAVAMGRMSNYRNRYVESMEARAIQAELTREAEASRRVIADRLATARNLHDVIGHRIAAVNLHAAAAAKALPGKPDDALRSLSTIKKIAQDAIGDIGHLLNELKSTDAQGSSKANGADAHDILDVARGYRDRGLPVNVRFAHDASDEKPVDPALMSAIREGLSNAEKHGSWDAPVELTVFHEEAEDCVVIRNKVHDAGHPELSMGHGLKTLEGDVAARGGRLMSGRRGTEFTLDVRVPAASRIDS